jgi:Inovirus Coat protein B
MPMELLNWVKIGIVELDTGSALLDIGGAVFVVLALAVGFKLIRRVMNKKQPNDDAE